MQFRSDVMYARLIIHVRFEAFTATKVDKISSDYQSVPEISVIFNQLTTDSIRKFYQLSIVSSHNDCSILESKRYVFLWNMSGLEVFINGFVHFPLTFQTNSSFHLLLLLLYNVNPLLLISRVFKIKSLQVQVLICSVFLHLYSLAWGNSFWHINWGRQSGDPTIPVPKNRWYFFSHIAFKFVTMIKYMHWLRAMLHISVSNRHMLYIHIHTYIYCSPLFFRDIALDVSSDFGFLNVSFISPETDYLYVEKIQKNQEGNLDQHVSSKKQYYLKQNTVTLSLTVLLTSLYYKYIYAYCIC